MSALRKKSDGPCRELLLRINVAFATPCIPRLKVEVLKCFIDFGDKNIKLLKVSDMQWLNERCVADE